MRALSAAGRQTIEQIAQRHDFSSDAVLAMLEALLQGQGRMAQFSHPEFGGPGQWMLGGMTMVSDMFNHRLKGRIDDLCSDLSALLASQPDLFPGSGEWWPPRLGQPASAGAQNGVRYAYFPQARRLAIEIDGRVTVYDTLDHRIGGFSQQQSHGGSLSFTSQHGLVDVARLPVISTGGGAPAA